MADLLMIRYENVTLRAGDRDILRNVSFHVAQGEKVALAGESGSGKTSLLLSLVGGFHPVGGNVLFNGGEVSAATVQRIRAEVAFVGQEPVMGAESVRDALLLPFSFKAHRGAQPADEALISALTAVRLDPDMLSRSCDVISGGEKQRIALARASLLGKRVFLLDEVTSSLDPESKSAVFELLSKPVLTVFSVSHDLDWIRRCDRLLELVNGGVVERRQMLNNVTEVSDV